MSDQWKPNVLVAVLLGVFTCSFTFLYLNKTKLFLVYFIFQILVVGLDLHFDQSIAWICMLVCPIHGYWIAKNYQSDDARRWFSQWWAISVLYMIFVVPILLCRILFYDFFSVPAGSMSPNINQGDYVLVQKHGFGDYSLFGKKIFSSGLAEGVELTRGKIYVFYSPHKPIILIKRLVGKPGDTISVQGDQIKINGVLLKAKLVVEYPDYIVNEENINNISYRVKSKKGKKVNYNLTVVVPSGQYFFLGDNRDNSMDSRIFGLVSEARLVGELAYVWQH